jgi:hypothetical protein
MRLWKSVLLSCLLFAGSMGAYVEGGTIDDQINVFGVRLFSSVDYKEINGVRATQEPCLKGYERHFDALDIVIGYGFNKKIRKITTLNPKTSLFGIRPGTSFEEGKQKIIEAGLTDLTPPFTYRANGCSLTLLVDEKEKIFGLTVESLD